MHVFHHACILVSSWSILLRDGMGFVWARTCIVWLNYCARYLMSLSRTESIFSHVNQKQQCREKMTPSGVYNSGAGWRQFHQTHWHNSYQLLVYMGQRKYSDYVGVHMTRSTLLRCELESQHWLDGNDEVCSYPCAQRVFSHLLL